MAVIDRKARNFTLQQWSWCEAAQRALAPTFKDATEGRGVRAGVENGSMDLWCVNSGESWCVTQKLGGMLYIWCYAGKYGNQFVRGMIEAARESRYSQLSFAGTSKAYTRAWRDLHPQIIEGPDPGHKQIIFLL